MKEITFIKLDGTVKKEQPETKNVKKNESSGGKPQWDATSVDFQ